MSNCPRLRTCKSRNRFLDQRLPREPLRQQHQDLKFTLHRKLLDKINLDALASIETQKLRNEVRSALTALIDAEQTLLSAIERNQIVSEVLDEVFGLGPLEPLLHDPTVSDILVNTHKQVYIERGGQLELTNVSFKDDAHLFRIIDKIVSQVGRRVDESSPMVDARLADGSRVNAIIPPLAVDGPLLSIRRFQTDDLMPADLVERLSMTQGMMQLLESAVKSRLNIVVAGGTGSGKTTLLNALSALISPKERVVTIEDAAELQLKQPHLVRLETRPPNIEGQGAIRQRELLVNSLRMRPDRIIVRRMPRRGSPGHASGHEHGPRRVDDDRARQLSTRCDCPFGSDGNHGHLQPQPNLHPAADLLGYRHDRPSGTAERRNAQSNVPHRGRAHGRGGRYAPRPVRL